MSSVFCPHCADVYSVATAVRKGAIEKQGARLRFRIDRGTKKKALTD